MTSDTKPAGKGKQKPESQQETKIRSGKTWSLFPERESWDCCKRAARLQQAKSSLTLPVLPGAGVLLQAEWGGGWNH